jgi:hypothetical protein
MKKNHANLAALLILISPVVFAGPNDSTTPAGNPVNGDATGTGALARQMNIYAQDAAEKAAANAEAVRIAQEQIASLAALNDRLETLQSPNAGGLFREVDGETNFIYDTSSGWANVCGKVLAPINNDTDKGIIVHRDFGLDAAGVAPGLSDFVPDVFVSGYPGVAVDNQVIFPCWAKADPGETFKYTTGENTVRVLQKYNYGTTVTPSPEQLDIQVQITQTAIYNHPLTVKQRKLQARLDETKAAGERKHQDDLVKASNGDAVALASLADYYRDSDPDKSADYAAQAKIAEQKEIERVDNEARAQQETLDQQKFDGQLAIAQSDNPSISSMIFVGKGYRDGKGTKKDLDKAIKWFRTAEENGSTDAGALIETCMAQQ